MSKENLINKSLMGLLKIEFKSDNTIKSKALKYIVKKILPHHGESCLILLHIKPMKTYCLRCKKNILQTKILVLKKLNKID